MKSLLRRVRQHVRAYASGPGVGGVFGKAGALGKPAAAGIAVIIAGAAVGVAAAAGAAGAGSGTRSGGHAAALPEGAGMLPADTGVTSAAGPARRVRTQAAFSGIILPDLLVVMPGGLTASDLTRLRAISGVRDLIAFDGAQITVAGTQASVIGVRPADFRSWVPLRTASDQALWTQLAAGDFVASTSAADLLGLSAHASYALTGAATVRLPFAGSARLGIAGVDVLVNQAVSRKLGLVHLVAALISAPGPAMAGLTAAVRRVLGAGARLVGLRGQAPLAVASQPGQITNYLQLFQASAARYCPVMSWTVLAAIGQIESGDGANVGPSSAGALGPMQFMPATWAEWGIDGFGPAGPPDVMNPFDAVPSAARMLCADGAASGTAAGLRAAIFAYNHADWYVSEVLALAAKYAAEYH